MLDNGVTIDQAAALAPLDVREYVKALGWKRIASKRPERVIFSRPDGFDQLIFLDDPSLEDYGPAMFDVLGKLAAAERRSVPEVYVDLLTPNADTVRAGVMSEQANRGQLSLDYATSLLTGLRQSVLAAAHTAVLPRPSHPRLNRADALALIRSARLNQSERSSYTVSVTLPLRSAEDDALLFLAEPFARQASKVLMRSLDRLYTDIEADSANRALEPIEGQPVISANLCDGLLKMQPDDGDDRAVLKVGMRWAATRPATDMAGVRTTVQFRRDHFDKIADLYAKLLPAPDRKPRVYFGTVEGLSGEIGSSGRREGDVELNLFIEGNGVRTRVFLNADQHQLADNAYMSSGATIRVVGTLESRPRVSLLTAVTRFGIVEGDGEAKASNSQPT